MLYGHRREDQFRDGVKRASWSLGLAYVAMALAFVSLAFLPGLSQLQGVLFPFAGIEAAAGAFYTWLPVDWVLERAGRKEAHRLRKLELWRAISDSVVRISVWVGGAFVVLDVLERQDLASRWAGYVIFGAVIGLGGLHAVWRYKRDVDTAWERYPI